MQFCVSIGKRCLILRYFREFYQGMPHFSPIRTKRRPLTICILCNVGETQGAFVTEETTKDNTGQPVVVPSSAKAEPRKKDSRYVRQEDWAFVKSAGWFMHEIDDSPIVANVDIDSSPSARTKLRAAMSMYFDTLIDVFPKSWDQSTTHRSLLRRMISSLKPGFIELWPEYMEERLKKITEAKFGVIDKEVRKLIEELTKVFLHNMSWYMFWKRIFQAVALAAEALVALSFIQSWGWVPNWTVMLRPGPNAATSFEALPAFILLSMTIFGAFLVVNAYLFHKVYSHALKISVDVVANKMKDRMASLHMEYLQYVSNLEGLRTDGQFVSEEIINRNIDAELSNFDGFYYFQVLLWLAKRVEYMEAHLFYEMAIAQRKYAIRNFIAWSATLAILGGGLFFLWAHAIRGDSEFAVWIMALASAFMVVISWFSYYFQKWNSGKYILKNHFGAKMADWWTSDKFRLDATLGARYQRALARIRHQDDVATAKRGG